MAELVVLSLKYLKVVGSNLGACQSFIGALDLNSWLAIEIRQTTCLYVFDHSIVIQIKVVKICLHIDSLVSLQVGK